MARRVVEIEGADQPLNRRVLLGQQMKLLRIHSAQLAEIGIDLVGGSGGIGIRLPLASGSAVRQYADKFQGTEVVLDV